MGVPFVGPKGGKYKDSKHKVPWVEGHSHEHVTELQHHIKNTPSLSRQSKELKDKHKEQAKAGKYDHDAAHTEWREHAEWAAEHYKRAHGRGGYGSGFNKEDTEQLAHTHSSKKPRNKKLKKSFALVIPRRPKPMNLEW